MRIVVFSVFLLSVVFLPLMGEAKPAKAATSKPFNAYKVGKGETLQEIAEILGVTVADLKKWNHLKGEKLRPGMVLRYRGPKLVPQSIGSPASGRLVGGVNIDPDGDNKGLGWVIAERREATYGTPETVRALRHCCAQFRSHFSRAKADPIVIGDLSKRSGGPLPPHKSHQSGRDVDIGYVLKTRSRSPEDGVLRHATPATLDLEKQWFLTKCFLDKPETQLIFMEASIVNALKDYLRRIYKKRALLLRKYLQYFPGGGNAKIVADDEHTSHMHVRFKCPKSSKQCVP